MFLLCFSPLQFIYIYSQTLADRLYIPSQIAVARLTIL
jgi:hypothetical protein